VSHWCSIESKDSAGLYNNTPVRRWQSGLSDLTYSVLSLTRKTVKTMWEGHWDQIGKRWIWSLPAKPDPHA
jgi:hypothetical protein